MDGGRKGGNTISIKRKVLDGGKKNINVREKKGDEESE